MADRLTVIFQQYPPESFKCDYCARETAEILIAAGLTITIITIQNREIFPGVRGAFIAAKNTSGETQIMGTTGFHEAVRIDEEFIIDTLVYQHYGILAINWDAYRALWLYPEEMEITEIREV